MKEIDFQTERFKHERFKQQCLGIRWQVIAEDLYRSDMNQLELFKEWLILSKVDEPTLNLLIQWIEDMIEKQFETLMKIKKMMEQGIESAITISSLKHGDI